MDEQTIVEQVKQNLPVKEAPTTAPPLPDPADPDGLHNNLPLENMLLEQQLFDHFNVGRGARQSTEVKEQVKTIMEWAKDNANGAEVTDFLNTILHQENMMGIQLKEDKMFKLYKFVKLNQQRQVVEAQMKALYGG